MIEEIKQPEVKEKPVVAQKTVQDSSVKVEEKKPETTKKPKDTPPKNPYKKGDYKEFVKFYALPSIFREEQFGFKTEQDFAKHFKIGQDTLVDWKKKEEFVKDVDEQLKKWGADKTPEVIAALLKTIEADGKAAEVKLWLQFIKGWKEGMIVEQPSIERNNTLDKLLENAKPEVKRQFDEFLKKLLPSKREGGEGTPVSK